MTIPWAVDPQDLPDKDGLSPIRGFHNSEEASASLSDLEHEYCRLMGYPYPITEMTFARSWMLFRVRNLFILFWSGKYQKLTIYLVLFRGLPS